MMKKVACVLSLTALISVRALCAADNNTEFFLEDDLTVYGETGTYADPDMEIKGFTVFGATQPAYDGILAQPGNVVVNGQLRVSSEAYFAGVATFTDVANIYILGGADKQVLAQDSDGSLKWSAISMLGNSDNLGNHVATTTLDMDGNPIYDLKSVIITDSGLWISTADISGSGIFVSTGGAIITVGIGNGSSLPGVRGNGAVDLQTYRSGSSRVASGMFSVIGGGAENTASGSGYSVVSGGVYNQASGTYSAIGGGMNNLAFGQYSFVGGGYGNTASNDHTSVLGGWNNKASGLHAIVGGGEYNISTAPYSTVGGGYINTSSGAYSAVIGGARNIAQGVYSVVGGGAFNVSSGPYSAIIGGYSNSARSDRASVSGGSFNNALGIASFIGGGSYHTIDSQYGAVAGGSNNKIESAAYAASIGGGEDNVAVGSYAAVPGGRKNAARGNYSFAAGYMSSSTADGSFTWSDSRGDLVANDVADQVRFKAEGGFWVSTSSVYEYPGLFVDENNVVGIGTVTPQAALDVVSTGTAVNQYAQIWRAGDHVVVASMTAGGALGIKGPVRIGIAAGGDPAGTIQFNGANFMGYDGSSWKTFDVSGGGWSNDGTAAYVSDTSDLVGIGVAPALSGHKVQVLDTANDTAGLHGIYSRIVPPTVYGYSSFGAAGSKSAILGVADAIGAPSEWGLFGVAGYLTDADQITSAGVFGAADIGAAGVNPKTWGALGYRDNVSTEWAGYFTGNVKISSDVVIGSNTVAAPDEGAIRWDGSHFQGYTGADWRYFDIENVTAVVAASNSKYKENADYICDGTADQSEINTALAAVGTGGTVVLLDGTYNLSNSVTITLSNSRLIGAGKSTVLRRTYTGGAANGLVHVQASNADIRGLTVDNSFGSAANTDHGVLVNAGLSDVNITDVRFKDTLLAGYGVNTLGGPNMRVTVTDNSFSSNFAGIYLQDCDYCQASRNIIESAAASQAGIYLTNCDYSVVAQNILRSNNGKGISFSGGQGNTISDNILSGSGDVGIYMVASSRNLISANKLYDCGGANGQGLQFLGSNNNSVTGNMFTEPTLNGWAMSLDATSNTNFIAANTYTGYDPSMVITDASLSTQYGPQMTPDGYIFASTSPKIGLGTSKPETSLHVYSTASLNASVITLERIVGDTIGNDIHSRKARGTPGGKITVAPNDKILSLKGLAWNGLASAYEPAASIGLVVDGVGGDMANDMPGRVEFATTQDGSSAPQTRMVIKNDGNVGISSAVPVHTLVTQSRNGSGLSYPLAVSNDFAGNTDEGAGISFYTGIATGAVIEVYRENGTDESTSMRFRPNYGSGLRTGPVMTLDSRGYLGLGTEHPYTYLTVAGASGGAIGIHTSANMTSAAPTTMGNLQFSGYSPTYPERVGAVIRSASVSTWTDAAAFNAPTSLQFYTQDANTTDAMSNPRVVIEPTNNLRFKMGNTTSAMANAIGKAGINLSPASCAAGAEAELMTFTIPLETFSADGKGIRVKAWGVTQANGNAKTVRLKFRNSASTYVQQLAINDITANPSGLSWIIEAVIFRSASGGGYSTSASMTLGNNPQTAFNSNYSSALWDNSTNQLVVAVTGQCPTAANDITQNGLLVEYLN